MYSPLAELAAQHGIKLISIEELPPSYEGSLRVWLNHRIATLAGVHKRRWAQVKEDPQKLQRARETNRAPARRYRERKKPEHHRTGEVK
jgi:hypothetical protein